MSSQEVKKKALIVTSRNVHYPLVLPVIRELSRRNWRIQTLHLERIWEKAENLLSKTTKRRSLASFFVTPARTRPSRTKTLIYNLIAKIILHAVNIMRLEKPSVVIVMTDGTPPCAIAVLTGKLARIPTLLLLHAGMIGRNYDCPEFLVDRIAVPSELDRDVLLNCGIDESRLVVTGRPSYDALARAEKHFKKSELSRKLGLDPARRTIVYTTENLPSRESESMTRAICDAMKEFPGVQLVIKVHPSEFDLSMYKRVTKEADTEALITKDANIYEVLYVCDMVITGFSATALDAMILDKPVVTVNLTGLKDPLPFAESGAALGVYKKKHLAKAIKTGLHNAEAREELREARERFIYEHAYKLDGKSALRVANLIEQMVRAPLTSSERQLQRPPEYYVAMDSALVDQRSSQPSK